MCDVGPGGSKLGGVTGLVDDLVIAIVNNRIYWDGHPRVTAALQDILAGLEEQFQQTTEDELLLGVIDGYLVFDGKPLLGSTLGGAKLIDPIERMDSGGIGIRRDCTQDEILTLLSLLGDRKDRGDDWSAANARLAAEGAQRVRLLPPPGGHGEGVGSMRVPKMALEVPLELYQRVFDTLQGMSVSICRGEQLSLHTARDQIEHIMTKLDQDPKSMLNLARYEQYDSFTFGHSVRVCFLALNFSKSLTPDPLLRNRIGLAAMLHDVGKARVPYEILHAPHRLSKEEREEMEKHTTHGAAILLELENTDPAAVATAFGHHRTLLGQGYPKDKLNAPLSTITKIVKICDVYEALTAVRPYKPAMSPTRAYRIMISMKKHFASHLLRQFITTNGLYPVGTHVRMGSGAVALVERQTHDLERPVVTIVTTPENDTLRPEDRVLVDLSSLAPGEMQVAEGPLTANVLKRAG